jgi:hypothetical protein
VEVRHINRSSSATRHPKVYTSTNMLCLRIPCALHVVVGLPHCVTFAAFDSFI